MDLRCLSFTGRSLSGRRSVLTDRISFYYGEVRCLRNFNIINWYDVSVTIKSIFFLILLMIVTNLPGSGSPHMK